jgi:hypothetical protein
MLRPENQVQLDSTRITVRERTLGEILDLALHVMREYFQPWLATTLLAVIPLALINYALIGWMADSTYVSYEDGEQPLRFLWNMTLLVYLEAPLAGIVSIGYLGPAVFLERRTIRQVLFETLQRSPQWVWCQLFLRGNVPAWILLLIVNVSHRLEFNPLIEGFLLPALVGYASIFRALRPYVNEIILLERLPMRSANSSEMTLGRRSANLQGQYSGDLVVRFILASLVGMLLWGALCISTLVLLMVLFNAGDLTIVDMFQRFDITWYHAQLVYPAILWLIAGYFSVVEYLDYLDLRIKHEGWEVELLMRAEGLRLAGKTW